MHPALFTPQSNSQHVTLSSVNRGYHSMAMAVTMTMMTVCCKVNRHVRGEGGSELDAWNYLFMIMYELLVNPFIIRYSIFHILRHSSKQERPWSINVM